MSPDRDLGRRDDDGREVDHYGEEPPRSLFSALWFRALLAVLVLGILAAVAVPYLLDVATSPSLKTSAKPVSPAPTAPAAPSAITEPTAVPAPAPGATAPAPGASETAASAPVTTGAAPTPTGAAAAVTERAPSATTAAPATRATAPSAPTAVAKSPAKATKVAEAPKQAPKASATKPSSAKTAIVAATGGPYWVQVGAFREPETAKRLVARLREQGLSAEESLTGPTGPTDATGPPSTVAPRSSTDPRAGGPSGDRYDVVVSGASAADVDAKLATKGMTGETTPNGIVVRPSLPLREAVALSRELADDGMSVQVRRVGGPAPVPAPAQAQAPAPAPAGGVTLHRVRVGGFPDRATAMAAAKQLEEKGFKPFIARRTE